MNKQYTFVDTTTGEILTRSYRGPAVAENTPPGCIAIEGTFDHLSQRVDIATGEVVDYQPPQPDEYHEWDATTRRWKLIAARRALLEDDIRARAAIAVKEALSVRVMRELLLDPTNNAARLLLQRLDNEIASERLKLLQE